MKPAVVGRTPAANSVGRAIGTNATAVFNEPVTGVSGATFTLRRGTVGVSAVVSYNAATKTATLNPSRNLLRNTLYTATLKSGIKDAAGNPLTQVSWSFRTAR
ncbi:MAG: Ig-like domain-containing protein [Actinomycetota bacterium]|nr:Ig-like domain-containing protein [Actinomycetota bacterium]